MTQQMEISGSSQEAVAALGNGAGHGKKAKKGLFTQLLALVRQDSADKGSSPKDSTAPTTGEHQGSVALTRKPALPPLKLTSIDGEQKAKQQDKPELQNKVSIADVNAMVMDTRALSGKPGNANQGFEIEQAFLPVANKGSKQAAQGQHKQTGLHAHGSDGKTSAAQTSGSKKDSINEPTPSHNLTKAQRQWSASKLDAANTQSLTNKQPPHSDAKIQAGEAHQSVINRNAGAAKAGPKDSASQGLISSVDIANAGKVNAKELYTANSLKNAAGSTPQQISNNHQAEKHELEGKQATPSRPTHGEGHAGRVAAASQDIIASRTSADGKSVASQHRAAPVNVKAGSNLNATKNRSVQVGPTSAQKPSAQHTPSQQANSQHHAVTSLSAPAPLSSSAEGLGHMVDRSSISAKYAQSTSELHVQQVLTTDPVQIVQTQSNKLALPQTLPSSGPWSVSAAMQEIGNAASQERYRLELNLDPAHLGKIKVYLDSDANKQIQVHLVVDQSASRQIIEQHLPALRQALAQHGLDMGGFSMDSQHDQEGQPSASQHEQSDHAASTSSTPLETTESQISTANARLSIRV